VYRFLETLDIEDQEVFYQVMLAALPRLTDMQRQCLLLSILGLTQEQVGAIVGVNQKTVSAHFTKALTEIASVACAFQ